MDLRRDEPGDLWSRLLGRGRDGAWLYDPVGEDFRPDPGFPPGRWPAITFRQPRRLFRPILKTRLRALLRWLFVNGGMSVVFLGGIMAFAFIAFALGYR